VLVPVIYRCSALLPVCPGEVRPLAPKKLVASVQIAGLDPDFISNPPFASGVAVHVAAIVVV
jgi:hypothetical protein